ncbi:C4-dicarboxylate ABC transporter [Pseudarthrobacter sulfonivorans]|uniref:C4-dicarboxylate ABC transporter n=1 Tax=Pseudarthrobacter sulfonivorans TaxID=121292 RepID=A0A0U3GQC9_9MICC|nr:dicarboxylate/amino acid:cation symporter [Pseudarthrobacter sulfonivorans]ALV41398.1 C4-dicarboxylate ABC transporter [Pseudarthrobacter sulfonivorans]
MKNKMTIFIVAALISGVAGGLIAHAVMPAASRDGLVTVFDTIAHLFLNLIKMVIAPLIFAIIVTGITTLTKSLGLGGMLTKSLAWFLSASVIAGGIGFFMAHMLNVGKGLDLTATGSETTTLDTTTLDFQSFIEKIVPQSVIAAMSTNNALQILVFALLFGAALLAMKRQGHTQISDLIEELVPVMLKLTGYVMLAAPVGVFAAVAAAFTDEGIGAFATYGSFIGGFYLSLAGLWALMIGVATLILGRAAFRLLALVREPMFVAFSTSSSEAAFPKLIESMARYGMDRKTTGFVLPLGYSFNLDGSMVYMTFASVFLINAYGVDLGIGQQLAMVALLLLSSKGMAGVPRGSLVIVAAVVPSFGIPIAGIALLLVVDQILDMGRTATNILGNAIATAVIGRKSMQKPPSDLDDEAEQLHDDTEKSASRSPQPAAMS